MKTVNLELSKQLKEAGFPQKGITFDYCRGRVDYAQQNAWCFQFPNPKCMKEGHIAAPTAEEILERLPEWIDKRERNFLLIQKVLLRIELGKRTAEYWVSYETPNAYEPLHREIDITLANAAAKMWLYLKKEGLL